MNGPSNVQGSNPRSAPPAPALAGPPSFARALSQRGLLSPAGSGGYAAAASTADTGFWLGMDSIYESHLRRVAMEQAFAALRDEAAPGH